MDTIHAITLRGHCSTSLCLQYIRQIATQLDALHSQNRTHGRVGLRQVSIADHDFLLSAPTSGQSGTPANDIWQLAASAMELMLGNPILNGGGEKAQTARTPIPSLPQPEAAPLNRLLQRCLSYDPKHRPTAADIVREAEALASTFPAPQRPRRQASVTTTPHIAERVDRLWPEQMVTTARMLILLLPMLCFALGTRAQGILDPRQEAVTLQLINASLTLRHNDQTSWDKAAQQLKQRLNQFNLMDELQDETNDKRLSGAGIQSFGLNRLIADLKQKQQQNRAVQNTGKGLLDGTDSRFSYTLYEKGIRKGATATYTLPKRVGKQVIVVIPHDANQAYAARIYKNGIAVQPAGKDRNGITYFVLDADKALKRGDVLKLQIQNQDPDRHAAFVIINHKHSTQ